VNAKVRLCFHTLTSELAEREVMLVGCYTLAKSFWSVQKI